MNYPFIDGNKRTGMTAAAVFLENNGYIASFRDREIERFALKIVMKHLSVKQIAAWFKAHSKKTKRTRD